SPCFSQASPHRLHASAQAVQIASESGPSLATTPPAAEQIAAQSSHSFRGSRCSFLPSASSFSPWAEEMSQARAQSSQAFAQTRKYGICGSSSPGSGTVGTGILG